MKVAFTTTDHEHIDAHFGWAKEIDVYEISEEGYQFLETITFTGDLKEDGNEDKLAPKLAALVDCSIVYVTAIGASAAGRLIKQGVTPIKARSPEETISEVLNKLVQTLQGSPPPWLRKALQPKSTNFADEVENEATV